MQNNQCYWIITDASGTLCQCTKKNPELINYTCYKWFHYTIINFTFYDIKKGFLKMWDP